MNAIIFIIHSICASEFETRQPSLHNKNNNYNDAERNSFIRKK